MKPAGFHLLSFVAVGTLAAQEPTLPASAKTSDRLKEEIRAGLPPYTPPPSKFLDQPKNDGPESDPDLFALPKFTVQEKRLPRIEPNDLLTPRALGKQFAADYKKSLKGLDAVLNSFAIPILSAPISLRDPSPLATRGRELYRSRQNEDIRHVIEIGKLADPANLALAQEKTDLQQALDWQNRPAGEGRKK
jgi:hypothetical protein